MSEVVQFPKLRLVEAPPPDEVTPEVNADLVKMLKGVLIAAKRGEIVAAAIAMVEAGNFTSNCFCDGEGGDLNASALLVASVSTMQHRILTYLDIECCGPLDDQEDDEEDEGDEGEV